MQAALATTYGSPDVNRIAEGPTPSPKKNEVLIRIHAYLVNATDRTNRATSPYTGNWTWTNTHFSPCTPGLGENLPNT